MRGNIHLYAEDLFQAMSVPISSRTSFNINSLINGMVQHLIQNGSMQPIQVRQPPCEAIFGVRNESFSTSMHRAAMLMPLMNGPTFVEHATSKKFTLGED